MRFEVEQKEEKYDQYNPFINTYKKRHDDKIMWLKYNSAKWLHILVKFKIIVYNAIVIEGKTMMRRTNNIQRIRVTKIYQVLLHK